MELILKDIPTSNKCILLLVVIWSYLSCCNLAYVDTCIFFSEWEYVLRMQFGILGNKPRPLMVCGFSGNFRCFLCIPKLPLQKLIANCPIAFADLHSVFQDGDASLVKDNWQIWASQYVKIKAWETLSSLNPAPCSLKKHWNSDAFGKCSLRLIHRSQKALLFEKKPPFSLSLICFHRMSCFQRLSWKDNSHLSAPQYDDIDA